MARTSCRLVVVLLALLVSACTTKRAPQVGPAAQSARSAKLHVTNNNWADITVYAEGSGARQRLGTVTSMARRVFDLPRGVLSSSGDVRLVADPIGARGAHVTFPVQVWPGQTIDFTIENQMTTSWVRVR